MSQTKLICQTKMYLETLSKLLDMLQRSTEVMQSAYELHMEQIDAMKKKVNGEEPASR